MNILICGSRGQLGNDCTQVLQRSHEVQRFTSKELDICDPEVVNEVFGKVEPNVVINCAAFTKVDECEMKKELAWKVNVEGPGNLGIASKRIGAQLIHFSTDYVFDGKKQAPETYTEQSATNPVSYYGISKLEGEEAIRNAIDEHIILRTAWLYGIKGQNFLKTMLRLSLEYPFREITVVNDQFGNPTWSFQLALQVEKLIEARGKGTYHATSEGYCTWYELATCFLEKMEVPHSIIPCSTKEYPTPAKRPVNSILENQRLNQAGINLMDHWKIGLEQFVSMYKEDLMIEAKVTTS
ncbi:MAG: dTDP-4-dehydrorhamnose reductase [Desulfobacterales bacterium]|nr:dTDP-4-dehydrorhamnose reductase [Desulfobacterales bacterium]